NKVLSLAIQSPENQLHITKYKIIDCINGMRPVLLVKASSPFCDESLDEHQMQAALVVQLKRLMANREMTQTDAAKLVDMRQPDLSKLLRGQLKLVSVEKLLCMLTAFDQDIEIAVKPHRRRGEIGRITFIPA